MYVADTREQQSRAKVPATVLPPIRAVPVSGGCSLSQKCFRLDTCLFEDGTKGAFRHVAEGCVPGERPYSLRAFFVAVRAPCYAEFIFVFRPHGTTMTESVENLILEHLKALRDEFSAFKADTGEVKLRLTSLEERTSLLERSVANLHGDIALLHSRLDRMDGRMERIERRLEFVPSP